jgi:hypothetical protein
MVLANMADERQVVILLTCSFSVTCHLSTLHDAEQTAYGTHVWQRHAGTDVTESYWQSSPSICIASLCSVLVETT